MGLLDDIWDGLTSPIKMTATCYDPRFAAHPLCGPVTSSARENLKLLANELSELENNLGYLEYVPEFRDYVHKIEELRGTISTIQEAISKPLNYVSTYEDAKQLVDTIRIIRGLDPSTDPVTTARAYGAAMKSLGKLIEKLPPPANAVGILIAEMGRIFHQVVANLQPTIHNREPGLPPDLMIAPPFG